eukprot:15754760-Heterocapsa_arctica.AAC.1
MGLRLDWVDLGQDEERLHDRPCHGRVPRVGDHHVASAILQDARGAAWVCDLEHVAHPEAHADLLDLGGMTMN